MTEVDRSDLALLSVIQRRHSQWEKQLLVVSLPHAAAFGAWISRYKLDDHPSENFIAYFLFLIATTIWFGLLYNQFANSFTRNFNNRKISKLFESLKFMLFGLYPAFLAGIADYFREYVDRTSAMFTIGTLMSWMGCALFLSGRLHIKMMRELGLKLDD